MAFEDENTTIPAEVADPYNDITGSEFSPDDNLSYYSGRVGDYGGSVPAGDSGSIMTGKRRYSQPGNEYTYTLDSSVTPARTSGLGLRSAYARALPNKPGSPMPTLTMPTFTAPVRDEARQTALIQKAAAPGLRALRSSVTRAMATNEDNPNARMMTVREALAGYGQGLENVLAGAEKTGRAEYNDEFAGKEREAEINYQTEVTRRQQMFTAAMNDYVRRFTY